MPSDTFGEVVKYIEGLARGTRPWSMPDLLKAARLLEAAGRECRAGRMGYEDGEGDSFWYKARCFDNLKAARAALDALAPELSAALTPPTKEAP